MFSNDFEEMVVTGFEQSLQCESLAEPPARSAAGRFLGGDVVTVLRCWFFGCFHFESNLLGPDRNVVFVLLPSGSFFLL